MARSVTSSLFYSHFMLTASVKMNRIAIKNIYIKGLARETDVSNACSGLFSSQMLWCSTQEMKDETRNMMFIKLAVGNQGPRRIR